MNGQEETSTHLESRVRRHLLAREPDAAVTAVLESLGPSLLRFLRSMLPADDAADAYADVQLALWKGIPRFRWECPLQRWAYRIARNAAARIMTDAYRRRRVPLPLDVANVTQHEEPCHEEQCERSAWLASLDEALRPEERDLLSLRVGRALPWKEIARLLSDEGRATSSALLRKRFERLKAKLAQLALRAGAMEPRLAPAPHPVPDPGRHARPRGRSLAAGGIMTTRVRRIRAAPSVAAALLLALLAGCPPDAPPRDLVYPESAATYLLGLPIAPNVPTIDGGLGNSFSIAPPLPPGLALDARTGAITGTPSALAAETEHTVTARNPDGSCTARLRITVDGRLAVLFTSDEHSHVFATSPEVDDFPLPSIAGTGSLRGGVARRAAAVANERANGAARGVETVLVSAGDFTQGTLAGVLSTVTSPDLALMERMGYDAVAIGNHEFDLGTTALAGTVAAALARGISPRLVLTNVAFDPTSGADDALAGFYGEKGSAAPIQRARLVTTAKGLRVGVVAAMGPSAAYVAPLAAPLTFTAGVSPADGANALAAVAAQLQPAIDALRTDDGADVVVLLGHGGIGPVAAAPGDDERLAAALRGVDLVVSGHTHRSPDAIRWVTDLDARDVPVMQAGPYGLELGRAELVVHAASRAGLDTDPARSRFIEIDDRIVPSQDPALAVELLTVIGALEQRSGDAPSFLEATLSLVTGSTVTDAPGLGDLYYYEVGRTAFDVVGLRKGENDVLNLDTDAMLATANALVTTSPTRVALQNNGAIRGDLRVGATGVLSFSDLYNLVPNGADPVEGTPGYPLVRFHLLAAELVGALDATVKMAAGDPDFFLSPAGLTYAYDTSRDPAGFWVSRVALADGEGAETVLFDDALTPAWRVDPFGLLVPVVTTYYVASFAASAGVAPRDELGVPLAALTDAILAWPGGSHAKDHQALARFVADRCAANGGTLPSVYDASTVEGQVPRRVACAGPYCP